MTFDVTFWLVSTHTRRTVRVQAGNRGDATDEARDYIQARAGEHVVVRITKVTD